MAHQVDSLAYFGAIPWHKLGTAMTDAERRNLQTAIERAGLDWNVEAIPLRYTFGGLQDAAVDDAQGIVRTDNGRYLSTVGGSYTPVQNADALGLLEPLIDMGCTIEVLGALRGGRTVFGLLKMPEASLDVTGTGDYVDGYVAIRNPHDGSGSLSADLTGIRIVCANTEAMAYRKGAERSTALRLRHSSRVSDRIADAKLIMQRMGEAFAETGDTFMQLAKRKMGPAEIAAYIQAVIPDVLDKDGKLSPTVVERRDTLAQLTFNGNGNGAYRDGNETTAWAAYNAVTEYFDHIRPAEAKAPSAKRSAVESALFGANARTKVRALELAAELVAA